MTDLTRDLNDACMCGEPFYGRPCLWCIAKERIESQANRIAELEADRAYYRNWLSDQHEDWLGDTGEDQNHD